MMRFTTLLFSLVILLAGRGQAQTRSVSPVEASDFKVLTSYDSLQAFLARVGTVRGMKVVPVALSRQGRKVCAVEVTASRRFGSDTSKIRVLLFAQQHGNEPAGKEALTLLLAELASGGLRDVLARADLLIVPQMNPDGAELRQRRTSDGLDLNRNHVLLTSPETKGLHDLFREWMPQVTMDIHEYDSFSSSWSDSGFIRIADVQLGMLTNLNTPDAVRRIQHAGVFPFIATRMKDRGYHFQEYIVGSPGDRIRHSTTEINDGRQSFGILGTMSFIQEGRMWRSLEDELRRRALSQLASIEALLEYCAAHSVEIRAVVSDERQKLLHRAGSPVALRMDHVGGMGELIIPVRMLAAGRDTLWRVHPYHGTVTLLKSVDMPQRYLLERKDSSIVALLRRHHVRVDTVRERAEFEGLRYTVDTVGQTVLEEDTLPLLSVGRHEERVVLNAGDFVIPTSQLHSLMMAIVLEPESVWGLPKYPDFSSVLKEKAYPVMRTR